MLECWGLRGADPNGGVVRNYGIMYTMRPLRNFKGLTGTDPSGGVVVVGIRQAKLGMNY